MEDPETGEILVFVTNHADLGASTTAAIYKDRWQIEIFFKALKQNLKMKTFVETSPNTLKIQIWTALRHVDPQVPPASIQVQLVPFESGSSFTNEPLYRPRSLGLAQYSV